MWISELQAINVKSFADSGQLKLDKGINVIIGKNNTGKSTLLQCILSMQVSNLRPFSNPGEARRIGTTYSTANVYVQDVESACFAHGQISDGDDGLITIEYGIKIPEQLTFMPQGVGTNSVQVGLLTNEEAKSFILPYTLKRSTQAFNPLSGSNQSQMRYVFESLNQLADKIHPYTQSTHPDHQQFDDLCRSFIGYPMGIIESPNGHLPGIYTTHNGRIPISQMGDGVPNIVGLIVHLLKAEKRLFVIEELENSINPEPLKLLLDQIKISAVERQNQFLISTHSNVVLQSLASEKDCKIFEVAQTPVRPGGIPESSCTEIEKGDIEARRRVFMNLGYSLVDSDMFDAWLILEESSAQTVIRKFLIPHFAPRLMNILGIIVTGGYNQVANQFTALKQNFLYLHLTPAYEKRVWVIIDGGENERQVIDRLRQSFTTWPPEHFDQFKEHDFEKYYPTRFQKKVDEILQERDKEKKRKAKDALRSQVMQWSDKDIEKAKKAFQKSAQEIIDKLQAIEKSLFEEA